MAGSIGVSGRSELRLLFERTRRERLRIAIVGSRKFPRLDWVEAFVRKLDQQTIVVSGGAVGVDRTAEVIARSLSMQVRIHEAHWNHYGRAAGMIRNQLIVKGCDIVVAFYDGTSKGTANSIALARAMKKPLYIISELGTQTPDKGS